MSTQDSIRKAHAAYENGDFDLAFKEYQYLFEQGCSLVQSNLGFMYAEGKGVAKNHKEAVKYFRLAAERGMQLHNLILEIRIV